MERGLYPYFENFVNRTALENMNMICGERSSCRNFFSLLYRKFLKSSEIVYNRLEIKNDIAKELRVLRHDVVYEVFCFGLG